LQNHFGDKVYQTVIPRNVRLAEAPSYGESAISYAPTSKGAKAYISLANELLAIAEQKSAKAAAATA
jgi:chromosome partitioning protein